MISTTDPESMTADERRLEVASILASGLLRRVRTAKSAESPVLPSSVVGECSLTLGTTMSCSRSLSFLASSSHNRRAVNELRVNHQQ